MISALLISLWASLLATANTHTTPCGYTASSDILSSSNIIFESVKNIILLSKLADDVEGDCIFSEVREYSSRVLKEKENKRVNGLKIEMNTRIEEEEKKNYLVINYKFSYEGPRHPLNIIAPSLRLPCTSTITQVSIYAVGKSGKVYGFHASNFVQPFGELEPAKKRYLNIEKGSGYSDVLKIDLSEIRTYFLKKMPKEFDGTVGPKLAVTLRHITEYRGAKYDLDAWTGDLTSNLSKIDVGNW